MPMSEQETELRALLQERRIMKTLARYCVCLDEYDIEGVMACFTTDATADYGPGRGGLVRGREAIAARIARGQAAFRRTHHQLGQVAITLRRQTALATTYVTAWHERDDGVQEVLCLRYVDRLRLVEDAWLIAQRQVQVSFVDGFPGTRWRWVRRRRAAQPLSSPRQARS
jgi:ketosteroid isomerase-like protein